MKVLCDVNVILDVLLKRAPFFEDSYKICKLGELWVIKIYVSAISIDTLAYVLKRNWIAFFKIKDVLSYLTDIAEIAIVDKLVIKQALNSQFKDLEDAIQCFSATKNSCDVIVTRNAEDFNMCKNVNVLSPSDFIKILVDKRNK